MAVLDRLPSDSIISGYKGVIDFYLWKGMPCARRWPTWRKREPTPNEAANQADFAYITKALKNLPEYIIDQYKRMAQGTPFTWRDLAIRAYMSGIEY